MKLRAGNVYLPAALALALIAAPLYGNAQSARPRRGATVSRYNMAKEVTIQGTVQSIQAKPRPGMMFGGYLTVATAQGTVEAQVGRFLLRGRDSVTFAPGQQVKLVGLMTAIKGKSVLMTRLIETGGRTITVRNKNGFTLSPAARLRQARVSTSGGAR